MTYKHEEFCEYKGGLWTIKIADQINTVWDRLPSRKGIEYTMNDSGITINSNNLDIFQSFIKELKSEDII